MFKKKEIYGLKSKILTCEELKQIKGSDIRKYRDERCYTQSYMASQLGIGQSAYQKIETGNIKISMDRLIQIADILNKPIDAFINGNKGQSQDSTDVSQAEYTLMQKIILKQEKRIEELEIKIVQKEREIEELNKTLNS